MERYHELANRLDHGSVWLKSARVLPQAAIDKIRKMSLFKKLESVYGKFDMADEENVGREGIYWRLVRPNEPADIGPLHADAWFWALGHGITPPGFRRVKVWVAIYCEPGKSGLRIVPNSHQKRWPYWSEERHGFMKPCFDEAMVDLPIKLAMTAPGKAIVFSDLLLHGGAVNTGYRTRVSVEFTMFVRN